MMKRIWGYIVIATLFFVLIWVWTLKVDSSLNYPEFVSGGALFFIIFFLCLFNIRKRVPFLPLWPAHKWFLLHTVAGFLALSLFWLHAGVMWPNGLYVQILAFLFYLTTLSGIVGLVMEKVYPNLLTRIGLECIYERIPRDIAEIRNKAEALILECTEKTGSDTLAKHYLETLGGFFQRPRFFLNNIFGGQNAQTWVLQQCSILERFLNAAERDYLDQICALAETKRKIDFHYSLQKMLKNWLLIHVPLAAAVITMVVWHLIVIQVFFN
ncbi:MAG: hypothetical protein HOB18_08640 [Nitrospina sp.]|nr:hypothetical protein [Nitrospina sp.]